MYVLAEFHDSPPSQVDPFDVRVVCIGEAHAQTIRERLDQFFTSSHGPGYRGVQQHGLRPDNLYVAVLSPLSDPWVPESFLLNEYKAGHTRLPVCNGR